MKFLIDNIEVSEDIFNSSLTTATNACVNKKEQIVHISQTECTIDGVIYKVEQ